MAVDNLVGTYVFSVEGFMWAANLDGKKYHPAMPVVISDLLPGLRVEKLFDMPFMTGFVGSQYSNDVWPFLKQQWPPDPPPPPPLQPSPPLIPSEYVPNVGFIPFAEIGTFEFSPEKTVTASILWNFAGLGDKLHFFTGIYELQMPFGGGGKQLPGQLARFAGGTISLRSIDDQPMLLWDYVFLFTNAETQKEAVLTPAGRSPRPATGSGRMILRA